MNDLVLTGVQWQPKTQSVGIQCDLLKPIHHSSPCERDTGSENKDEEVIHMDDCYEPELEDEDDEFDSDDS